jgi:hypothetical protein
VESVVNSLISSVVILVALAASVPAQGIDAQLHKDPVPSELAAPIGGVMAPGGVRAVAGGVTLDLWFVKALEVGAAPPAWAGVAEGTLVGAVRVGGDFHDIRGRVIKAGVYTMRYGVQPDNGDHLGTSPWRDFLLLVPAALDTDTAARGHDGTVDLSKRTIGGSHPAVWSIDPPVTTEAVLAPHKTELGHQAIVVEVACAVAGKPAGALRFGIVLIGRIDA